MTTNQTAPAEVQSNDGLGIFRLFRPRYRIVRDRHAGFEVQIWTWWLPIWRQAGFANTHSTEERALEFARWHANPVVRYLGAL